MTNHRQILRQQMGKKGYDIYQQKFTTEAIEKNLKNCLMLV